MKMYKIYGDAYELESTSSSAPDAFSVKGNLQDEIPKGKLIGYVTMNDGSVVACYKKFNIIVPITILLLLIFIGAGVYYYLTNVNKQVITIGDIKISGATENDIIQYNGFMALRDNKINVNFTNGDYPCTIQIKGDGISCDPYNCEPGEYVESIPATYSADSGVVYAEIIITTETSTQTNAVTVEIPENNTANSPDGLDGYWKGEYIYGPELSQ